MIQLSPIYKPLVRRQPITTRTVQQWSVEAEEALMECYRTTDWEMFQEDYGDDIEGLTQCVTDYIKFCEESVVPTKKVRCFPNSKPWINRDIKVVKKPVVREEESLHGRRQSGHRRKYRES